MFAAADDDDAASLAAASLAAASLAAAALAAASLAAAASLCSTILILINSRCVASDIPVGV